ncbi:MAG: hypothetical protein IT565_02365 [Rhodospirillales bacterium]|nr:hypothetical protein [Rhodospirillales bacterium]
MSSSASPATVREIVGLFPDRRSFESAVQALLKAGFAKSDLSVLSSHDSLAVAEAEHRSWRDALVGLVGEIKYEGPLVAAGLIALAAGPVGAAVAGLIAAGVGAVAVKELLEEITSAPDGKDFARAVEAGSIILWVAVADHRAEGRAGAILIEHGASNVHHHQRDL